MERELLKYSAESMDAALKEVREGRMTCFAASKTFGVPRSTLRDKLSGRSPEGRQMGPNPVLTRAEEASLTTFCIKLLKCGFPINRDDLLDIVQKVVKEDKRKTPFTDDRPGKYWFYGFLQRNPQLTERFPEKLTGGRATVTEAHIRKWFADIETYIVEEERAGDVLLDPHRVFNFDESHFLLAKKGNIPCDVIESVGSVDPSWALGKSESGWMTTLTFLDYISLVFNPWLSENNVQRPVVVFADGHKSHLSLETVEFCASNGIILVALYPNSTHTIQPLDVSVFKSLKGLWEKAKRTWKAFNSDQTISQKSFPKVFKSALDQIPDDTVKNGFKRSGLFPFDANAVDYSKCVADQKPRSDCESADNMDDPLSLYYTMSLVEKHIGNEKATLFATSYGRTWVE
ncbi:hypothetical protein EMCRGX_G031235 [Ephydatia muelleri]